MTTTTKPLVIELFAGLHGWGEGFIAEGFRVVGVDIVDMCATLGLQRPAGIELVLQDVLTLHGSQFRDAAVSMTRRFSSRSAARKAASAQIAKIPFQLANWIAKVYKP
jgi:hypothetical protein